MPITGASAFLLVGKSAIGLDLITYTAIKCHLVKSEKAEQKIRQNGSFATFAVALYALLATLASFEVRHSAPATFVALKSGIDVREPQ